MIFDIIENYQKNIVNAKHELILIISKDDTNVIIQTIAGDAVEVFKIAIKKLEWLLPYVRLSTEIQVTEVC